MLVKIQPESVVVNYAPTIGIIKPNDDRSYE